LKIEISLAPRVDETDASVNQAKAWLTHTRLATATYRPHSITERYECLMTTQGRHQNLTHDFSQNNKPDSSHLHESAIEMPPTMSAKTCFTLQ